MTILLRVVLATDIASFLPTRAVSYKLLHKVQMIFTVEEQFEIPIGVFSRYCLMFDLEKQQIGFGEKK
jgi:hypothetical protein